LYQTAIGSLGIAVAGGRSSGRLQDFTLDLVSGLTLSDNRADAIQRNSNRTRKFI
jgi:hypothetical protein